MQRSKKRMPGFVGHVYEGAIPILYVVLCRITNTKVDRFGAMSPGESFNIATYRLTLEEASWWNHEERDDGAGR